MRDRIRLIFNKISVVGLLTSLLMSFVMTLSFHFAKGKLVSSATEILKPFSWLNLILFVVIAAIVYSIFFLFSNCVQVTFAKQNQKFGLMWLFIPFLIIFLYYLFYAVCYFPATVLPDTMGSITQILNGPETVLSNHHPIIFTSWLNIWIRFASLFTSNVNYGVFLAVLSQQFLIAFGFAITIYWCKCHGVSNWILCLMTVLYAFFSHFPMFATALWKDPLFSFGILMVTLLFASICVDQNIKENALWCLMVATCSFFVMGFRNNGIYVIVIGFVALLFLKRKCYGLTKLTMALSILIYALVSGPLYSALNIEKPSVEALGIPLQQTAYNLKYNVEAYSEEELDILAEFMPIQVWQDSYLPRIVDEIKWNPEWNETVFQNNVGSFLKVWFNHLDDSFGNYVLSYLMATQGFWDPFKQMNHEYYADMVIDNDFGIYRTTIEDRIGIEIIPPTALVKPLVGAGTCAWIIVFFLIVAIKRNGSKMVLPYIPSIALWLTLLLATPLAFGMRYALPLAFILPLLMVLPYVSVNSLHQVEPCKYSPQTVIKNLIFSMIGPLCFIVSIFFLIQTRDKFQLVSYSDQQQVIGLTQDNYLEQHLTLSKGFDLNRISLWTQTDTSNESEPYSIYLALLNEEETIIWQADVSNSEISNDPLNPWTLFYCNDVHIEPGNYILQIHGNGENELSGLVVGPVYQQEKVVEPLIINGYASDLYINLKVMG